jgi:putative DNA primase/helicase
MSLDDNLSDLDAQVASALANTHDPTRWFSKEDGLLVADLAETIKAAGTVRLGYDGRLYRYHDGVYRPDGDTWAKIATRHELGFKIKKRHFDEVLAYLRADDPFIPEHPPRRWINCRNGLLDWHSGELHPHNPDIPSAVQIAVDWVPDSVCPNIDQFLQQVLPDGAVPLIQEVIGYALYVGNPFSKSLLLVGPGGNGKSKLLNLVKALAGNANVSAVPLQALAESRFAAAELYGRLANVCGDLDARAIKRTDLFKQVTGGDQVMAERKYGQPFTFTSFALPMFSANEPPISSDQSEAWFDRWLVIPMDRRFRGTDDDDPHIERRITTNTELQGLLVEAVAGLRRLMDRGRFQPPAAVEAAGDAYRDRLDSVRSFVAEECILLPGSWTPRSAIYTHYKTWASDNGRLAVSATTFNDRLRRDYHGQIEEKKIHGIRRWEGLGYLDGPR